MLLAKSLVCAKNARMRRQTTHRKTLRGFGTLFLSFLMAVQVTFAFFPGAAVASGDGIQVVICGAGGLRTITIDPTDGSVSEGSGQEVVSKCPFCVVGLAVLSDAPDCGLVAAVYTPVQPVWRVALDLPDDLCDRPKAIRAPPLSL